MAANAEAWSLQLSAQGTKEKKKSNLSSFLIFSMEQRELIVAHNTGMCAVEIAKCSGERWRGLNDAQKLMYKKIA